MAGPVQTTIGVKVSGAVIRVFTGAAMLETSAAGLQVILEESMDRKLCVQFKVDRMVSDGPPTASANDIQILAIIAC